MSDKIARVCDYCGKTDVLDSHEHSNDGLTFTGDGYFVFMRDIKKSEACRPTFSLNSKHFCPECLPRAITEWIEKSK